MKNYPYGETKIICFQLYEKQLIFTWITLSFQYIHTIDLELNPLVFQVQIIQFYSIPVLIEAPVLSYFSVVSSLKLVP